MRLRALAALALCLALEGVAQPAAQPAAVPEIGSLQSAYGCRVHFRRYAAEKPLAAEVLLAHGFKRDLDTMRGWAEHWLASGITTTIMTLCNSSWFNGHAARNAEDLVALADQLAIERRIYAGYSAGGLSAYLAALQDERTFAYLALDAVDAGDMARDSPNLTAAALFLSARPSLCNAGGNFAAVISRYAPSQHRLMDPATHCEFEWPAEARCNLICGRIDKKQREEARAFVRATATQWLREVLGLNS